MHIKLSILALSLMLLGGAAHAQPAKKAAPAAKVAPRATPAAKKPAESTAFKKVSTTAPKVSVDVPASAVEKVINNGKAKGKLWQGATKDFAFIVQSMQFAAPISSTPAAQRATLKDAIYKSMVSGFTEGTGGKAQLQFEKNITVNGVEGRDYKVSNNAKFGKMRCFVLDNGMVALFVLGQEPSLAAAARTLNSFIPVN